MLAPLRTPAATAPRELEACGFDPCTVGLANTPTRVATIAESPAEVGDRAGIDLRDARTERSVLTAAPSMLSRALSFVAVACVFFALALPSVSSAQARPTATILRTHVGDGASEATGRGFDRVLRQRLDSLRVAEITGSVELDLESVQLALGCMGESVECLRAAATQAGSETLVFASIESSGSIVVSVMRFDATEGRLRRAVRTVDTEAAVLEAAEPMARELWDLPPVAEQADPVVTPVTPPSRSLSPGPLVLVAIGGASLIAGAVLIGHAAYLGDIYRTANPRTEADVNAATAALRGSQDESVAASVLLAAGGAIAVAGTIWLLAAGNEDGSSPLAVLPFVSPDGVSLTLAGTLPTGGL